MVSDYKMYRYFKKAVVKAWILGVLSREVGCDYKVLFIINVKEYPRTVNEDIKVFDIF